METIVSNESSEIIQMLNRSFDKFAKNPALNLEPQEFKDEMKAVDSWIYGTLNNGVYRCGFASTQKAYDTAISELTESFYRVSQILENQRFISGDQITLSDVRLFPTLLRFDEVYIVYFKCNTRSIKYTPAILNYCRDIYQMAGVKDTVNMEQIKMHYLTSHPHLNKFSILPRGTNFEKLLEEPHNRDQAGASKKQKVDA
jgi:glutathionyl-hydroquinone reductase